MSTEINFRLLSNIPKVFFNTEEIHIPDSSLDLFIYLAVENQTSHDRDVLTRRLYESTVARDRLRQTALGNLNKEIKKLCIRPSPSNLVSYDGSHVTLDVHNFIRLIQDVDKSNGHNVSSQVYRQWTMAYELYQNHFLEDYSPTLYGLTPWIQEQRRKLRELFHRLLEKLVQYEIAENLYEQAEIHAERWHQSLPDSELPLQYLIWVAVNMGAHVQALNHLNKLRELGSSQPRVIGYSFGEWQRLLERGIKPDRDVLNLRDIARVDVSELLDLASENLTGRTKSLEDIFETLFVDQQHRLLCVTGERGIGKSVLAEAVTSACLQAGLVTRSINVSVTAETDLDQVLNAIAVQLDKPNWLDLNYRSKFLNIAALFEEKPALLVLDQQEAGNVFSDEFKTRIKKLSEQVIIIVCCHESWKEVYEVALQPLDLGAVINLFKANTDQTFDLTADGDALQRLTGGSPLALKLFVSTMSNAHLSLNEALAQVASVHDEAGETTLSVGLGAILQWCWRLLNEPARRMLASLVDFDLLEGPSLNELRHLHNDLPDRVIEDAVQHLVNMGLIQIKTAQSEEAIFQWHSLVHEFLWKIDALSCATNNPHFKAQMRERFCNQQLDFLRHFTEDYSRLATKQRNVLRAFDLILELGKGAANLGLFGQFLSYLIRRGLFSPARRLANLTDAQIHSDAGPGYIAFSLNVAKLDIKQGEMQIAEERLQKALALAMERNDKSQLAEIYQQLGIIANTRGQIDKAQAYHEQALLLAQHHEQYELMATILANLGATSLEHADYETAKAHLERSLKIAEKISKYRIMEYTLTALSIVAFEQLDFDRALDLLAEAMPIANMLDSPERYAVIFMNLGATHYYLGQFQEAAEFLTQSLELAQNISHDELTCYVIWHIGKVQAANGNLFEAERSYKRVLITAQDLMLTRLGIRTLLDIGKLYFQMHHWQMARNCFRKALEKTIQLPDYQLLAEALFGLGISILAETWLIGQSDVTLAVQEICGALGDNFFQDLSEYPVTMERLHKAEFIFQHGLINHPEIDRYCISSAWAQLLNIENSES